MLRDFFYSTTILFNWVSIRCNLWGIDTLGNEGVDVDLFEHLLDMVSV